MLNFENSEIANMVIHRIGNKYEGGMLEVSQDCFFPEEEDIAAVLKNYFLSPFKREAFYHFSPLEESLDNNPVYHAANQIFESNKSFYAQSVHIAQHLFEQSNRPGINPGELYIVYFTNLNIDEGVCNGIGIFKSENKETFLKLFQEQDSYQLHQETGISVKKTDKACLIFHTDKENGYKVLLSDKANAKDSMYWSVDFLGLQPADDSYFQTTNYLNLCKDFVKDIYNRDNDVPRADQIDMLNRSLNFFKNSDIFSEPNFMNEVVQKPEVISAFENFKEQYTQANQVPICDTFHVSDYAVKDEKKYFKHILKLDKNFHVYIHGQRKYIEKGYDNERDLSYYKLFFREEE